MRWLNFIFSHSIFIALCAVALCYQTYTLLHLAADNRVYALVFFSTLCSYNFYWLISKFSFHARGDLRPFVRRNLSYILIFSLSATAVAATLYRVPGILPHIVVGLLLTLIYSLPLWPFRFAKQLRKAGFLKTTLLAFTWAYVTTVLPAAGATVPETTGLMILFIARFYFMGLLCIIFDRRDIKVDKLRSLHSLATDVGPRTLDRIILLAFCCYAAAGLAVRWQFHDNAQLIAFIITGVAVWMVHQASRHPRGYIFYYFIVDGLMLFSAAATFFAAKLSS